MLVKEERALLASASDLDPVKSFVVQALQVGIFEWGYLLWNGVLERAACTN